MIGLYRTNAARVALGSPLPAARLGHTPTSRCPHWCYAGYPWGWHTKRRDPSSPTPPADPPECTGQLEEGSHNSRYWPRTHMDVPDKQRGVQLGDLPALPQGLARAVETLQSDGWQNGELSQRAPEPAEGRLWKQDAPLPAANTTHTSTRRQHLGQAPPAPVQAEEASCTRSCHAA